MNTMGLGPGYAISKHVRLVRMLGRGGMGSVWIADHLALKTQVAVKFMSSALATDPNMLTRFEREATSAAQIKSPHVVHILDHGVTGDAMPYIVMELLEGEDLSTRLKRTGPLPPEDVATIVLQMCKALGKAHKLGIVHRDIKPSNIFLLDTDGDIFVKVLDFGIAKPGGTETSDVTSTGAIVGTVVYMSPEQLLNAKHVDYRADLWSVAVVAYRAMTGRLPFSDEDGIGSLCLAFEQSSFVPPSELNPRITPEIDAWFRRAFKRDPAARFPSAKEMVSELFAAVGVTSPMSTISLNGGRMSDPRSSFDPPSLRLSESSASAEEEAKATVIEPSQSQISARTARGAASPNSAGSMGTQTTNPSNTLSSAKEPATLGTAAALTVPGTSAGSMPAPSGGRKIFVGIAAALGLLLLGAFFAMFLTRRGQVESWMGVGRDQSPPRPAAEAPSPTGPSVTPLATAPDPASPAPPSAPTGAPNVAPAAPSAAPSAEPSAATSAIPSGQPAASSAPAAGPRPQVRPGGTSRPPSPEKDYGF